MLIKRIRQHLTLKLLFSYLVIILVGVIVLATAVEFAIPTAFDRHMAGMMGGTGMGMMGGDMGGDLFGTFRAAVNEALTWAALAAIIAALVVSVFVSRQVVAPLRSVQQASQRIANGNYEERVPLSGDPSQGDELVQLALSFNRMAEKLAQTENKRRQLIGDVSHELRTPLTTIKGSMEGLMDGVLPASNQTYQQIYREADRLQRLVADLQELSRVEALAYELQPAPAGVAELIENVCSRLERQYTAKGVALDSDIPQGLPSVLADEDRINQVLTNLVGNALQYTPAGGRVKIQGAVVHENGTWIRISVRDTGVGISPEHLPHIFERFYRVEKSRSRAGGGSGIGLTIARHLVEAHGGRIWAESEGAGKGSTFTFTLPAGQSLPNL